MSLLHYDPLTGAFRWLVARPNGVRPGDQAGSVNSKGYLIIKIGGRAYKAARLAHLYVTGVFPPLLADHENRDRGDNRWVNIRKADHSQNCSNRIVTNQNGYKGVTYKASRDRYEAYIKPPLSGGKSKYLGRFRTAAEAGAAYAAAANDLYGPYARSA